MCNPCTVLKVTSCLAMSPSLCPATMRSDGSGPPTPPSEGEVCKDDEDAAAPGG